MNIATTLKDLPRSDGWTPVRIPVSIDMNGMEVVIWAHVLDGGEGPTLTLLSGLHGNEWLHLDLFDELHRILPDSDFRGRVVMVPELRSAIWNIAGITAMGT